MSSRERVLGAAHGNREQTLVASQWHGVLSYTQAHLDAVFETMAPSHRRLWNSTQGNESPIAEGRAGNCHSSGYNILYVDGHLEWVRKEDVLNRIAHADTAPNGLCR